MCCVFGFNRCPSSCCLYSLPGLALSQLAHVCDHATAIFVGFGSRAGLMMFGGHSEIATTRSVISSWTEQLDTNNKILKANRANDAPVYLCANISPYCWSNTSHQWCTIAGTMHAVNCFKAPMRQLYVYMMRPIPSHWRLIEPYNKYIQSICSAHNARVKCNCKNSMKYDGALDNGHTRT